MWVQPRGVVSADVDGLPDAIHGQSSRDPAEHGDIHAHDSAGQHEGHYNVAGRNGAGYGVGGREVVEDAVGPGGEVEGKRF